MMRLAISQFMSLDGVVQAPGGAEEDTDGGFAHGGWSMPYFDPEVMGGFIDDAMAESEALLFGRRTWQAMAAHWPERDDDGDPFTTTMNEITKYVVSRTLTQDDLHWRNSFLVPGDDAAASVSALLEAGDDGVLVMMGSSQLSRALIEAGLVDEYRLMIEPVLLGGGKTVFPTDGEKRPLQLVHTSTASSGVLCCVYRPGGAPPAPDWEG